MRQINGYPNYKVSAKGAIISTRGLRKTHVNPHGYHQVDLWKDGKSKTFRVHTLVAQAYIGDRPKGYVVNHKDGNKLNNHWTNLEYVTSRENTLHAHRTGLAKGRKGVKHHKARLNPDKVRQIRKLYAAGGETFYTLADRFGVADTTISGVVNRHTWKHIA